MPTLQLKISPLQNPLRYRSLARALTDLSAQLLGKRPGVTAVMIEDLTATLLTPRCQQPRRIIKACSTHRKKSS